MRVATRWVPFLALASLTLVGCGGANAFAVHPDGVSQLQVLSGDRQTAPAGATLPQPVVVVALDEYGNSLPGVVLTADGQGSIKPAIVRTEGMGEARFEWMMPPQAGQYKLRISAMGTSAAHQTLSVVVTATAVTP